MRKHPLAQTGMTLIEVAVAIAVFATASLAAAHLVVLGMRSVHTSGAKTMSVAAAMAKMEELQSLAWRFDEAGGRISDPALAASPADALSQNVAGFAEYLDAEGQPAGDGPDPPPGAVYLRRWALRPLARAPEDTLVIQVLVAPLTEVSSTSPASGAGSAAMLTTARGRIR